MHGKKHLPILVNQPNKHRIGEDSPVPTHAKQSKHNCGADYVRARKRRRALMESLSFGGENARSLSILSAYNGTCEWILNHSVYREWLTGAGLLWIRGKPGAGKSTMMKFLHTRALQNSDTAISYSFNSRGDHLETSARGMYRSLLLQLLRQIKDLRGVFDSLDTINLDSKDPWDVDVNTLQSLFSTAVTKLGPRRITCFLDALDECDKIQIPDIIAYFTGLGESAVDTPFICFSSRHCPDISVPECLALTLESELGHTQAIETYIQAGLHKRPKGIEAQILQKAAGNFIWATITINILNCNDNRDHVSRAERILQELPCDCNELYKHLLAQSNDHREVTFLSFKWLLYAKRPMKPEELVDAVFAGLGQRLENPDRYDPRNMAADDIYKFICVSFQGLAMINEANRQAVQFVHESVREFLIAERGIYGLWSSSEAESGISLQSISHDRMKRHCYNYLHMDDIPGRIDTTQGLSLDREAEDLRRKVLKKFPFLTYATHQVLYHSNIAASEINQSDFLASFDLAMWCDRVNLISDSKTGHYSFNKGLPYILAEKNFTRLIDSIPWHDIRTSNRDASYGYPLFAALANGHREAVGSLLRLPNGLRSSNRILERLTYGKNFKVRSGQIPLSWAAENGYEEVLQQLISTSPIDGLEDQEDQAPLTLAAKNGHQKIVQQLIQNGADVELRSRDGRTPLSQAAESGQDSTIRLLIESGADIESTDRNGQTALSWAAQNGHQRAICLLVGSGADIKAKDGDGKTPLWWATRNGHQEPTKQLESFADKLATRASSRVQSEDADFDDEAMNHNKLDYGLTLTDAERNVYNLKRKTGLVHAKPSQMNAIRNTVLTALPVLADTGQIFRRD